MLWIAHPEKDAVSTSLEERLRKAADQFCAYSGLDRQEHSGSTLGLLFLRYSERVRCRHPHGYKLNAECVCP